MSDNILELAATAAADGHLLTKVVVTYDLTWDETDTTDTIDTTDVTVTHSQTTTFGTTSVVVISYYTESAETLQAKMSITGFDSSSYNYIRFQAVRSDGQTNIKDTSGISDFSVDGEYVFYVSEYASSVGYTLDNITGIRVRAFKKDGTTVDSETMTFE